MLNGLKSFWNVSSKRVLIATTQVSDTNPRESLDEIKTEQEIGGDITNYFTSSPSVYLNAAASKATADESSAKVRRCASKTSF